MGTPSFGMPQQQPAPTPAWVPYLNLMQGIRMDYPNTWLTQEQGSPVSFIVWFASRQQGPQDTFQENLSLLVQPVFAGTTPDAVLQGWQAMATQARVNVLETSATTLAGQHAWRVLFDTPPQPPTGQPNRVLLFLFLIGAKAFTVTYTGQGNDFELLLPTVQQMLATLQVR